MSPAMHDEFLLQYQLPILKQWGLVGYGCCENLTQKIDILRQIPNLRVIGVTPRADVRRCGALFASCALVVYSNGRPATSSNSHTSWSTR